MLLSAAFALLAGSAVSSDEAGGTEPAPQIRNVPVDLAPGETAAVHGGRVTTLVPAAPDLAGIRILEQPGHGHVSVNPDNTLALVLTGAEYAGPLSFRYEITGPDGETVRHTAALDVISSPQESSWGTSVNHYMLPVDAAGRVVVEHGADHRKVYVSGDGLTAEEQDLFETLEEDDRFSRKRVFMGARTADGAVAFDKSTLLDEGVMRGELGGTPAVAVADSRFDTGYVYLNPEERAVGLDDGSVRVGDSSYSPDDLPLTRIHTFDAMWFAWHGYYPETNVYA